MSRAARAFWLLALSALLGAGCEGTQGTLVVRHHEAAGSGGTAQVPEIPYVPSADVAWRARLNGAIDITQPADLFYLDVDLQDEADLAELRATGRHYLCYLSAGSHESYRADADAFPERVKGLALANFDDERWLDVRDPAVRQIMQRRISDLAKKGCSGIPPSSLDVHAVETGFALTPADAVDYASWLAERIHAAGMAAGLTSSLAGELSPLYDFGLAIDCMNGTQCSEYGAFTQRGKPVLHVEYGSEQTAPEVCKLAEELGFEPMLTNPRFDGSCLLCRDIL
jgi:hypothetical protein